MKHFGMCMNWKVVAGLVVAGLGVWAIAPNLIGAAAPLLILAVCPLSMIFMMKGMGRMGGSQSSSQPAESSQPAQATGTRAEQLAELKARHEAIAHEIAQLEPAKGRIAPTDLVTAADRRISVN